MGGCELFQHEPPEKPRQHPDRQEEAPPAAPAGNEAFPVKGETAAGHDHMHMRMVRERRAPSVEHGGHADARTQMLGIGGNGEHGL
jgi:hypothetical protein